VTLLQLSKGVRRAPYVNQCGSYVTTC